LPDPTRFAAWPTAVPLSNPLATFSALLISSLAYLPRTGPALSPRRTGTPSSLFANPVASFLLRYCLLPNPAGSPEPLGNALASLDR
jgi:hypothetical protein